MDPDTPDLQALKALLHQGKKVLQDLAPALQVLLGPDYRRDGEQDVAAGSTFGAMGSGVEGQSRAAGSKLGGAGSVAGTGGGDSSRSRSSHSQESGPGSSMRRSISTTASYADQLMKTVNEECVLLHSLHEQLQGLQQLQQCANSMEMQLMQMKKLKDCVPW
jgi:hypothetical protein